MKLPIQLGACLIVATVLSVSCSGGSSNSDDSEAAITTEEALAAAKAANLVAADFPSGWTVFDDDAEDAEPDPDIEGEECAYLSAVDQGFPGQIAFADSDSFSGPTQEVNTESSVFPTVEEAETALRTWIETLTRCKDEIEAFARTEVAASGQEIDFEYSQISGAGGRSGMRLHFSGSTGEGSIDFIMFRTGRIVSTLIYRGAKPNDADRDVYVGLLASRAAEADRSLAQD